MATDVERLVVSLSADVKAYENALARASGFTRTQINAIRKEAANAGGAAGGAFDGASRGVQRFGNSATAAAKQASALRAQTGNLAAQFQDISVQLAGGQSPFQIALQQGTQISAVLGGQGARGAVTALAGAFASLVSPVSLVTIGLIAAGGAAVQYFASLSGEGEKSADDLKKQSDLIRQVAKDWGDAVPAVQAYADALEQAQRVSDLKETGTILREQAYGDAKAQVEALSDAIVVLRSDLELLAGPEDVAAISELQSAFNNLQAKVEENNAASEDAQRVQDALNAVMALGAPTADGFAASLGVLAGALSSAAGEAARAESNIASAIDRMQQFRAAEAASMQGLKEAEAAGKRVTAEMERQSGLSQEQLDIERERARVRDEFTDQGAIASPDTIDRLAQERLAAEARRAEEARAARAATRSSGGGGGGRSAAVSDIDREREAVVKLIEQLEFEASLIGATAEEREKANALRRAGSAATAEQKARIEEIVAATYAETAALEANEAALERIRDLSRTVLGGLFEDLRDGANGAELLSNALNRVAENLVSIGLDNLITAAFPGGGAARGGLLGGRIIPGLLHSGGVAGRDGYGHGRSVSPGVFAGAARYHSGGVAGLRPGEVPAILQRGEVVIPKGGFGRSSGGTAVNLTFAPTVDARGADAGAVARLDAAMKAQATEMKATFNSRVVSAVRDPRWR